MGGWLAAGLIRSPSAVNRVDITGLDACPSVRLPASIHDCFDGGRHKVLAAGSVCASRGQAARVHGAGSLVALDVREAGGSAT